MFVQVRVLLVLSFAAVCGRLGVGGIEISLFRCFGTHAAERDELLEVLGVAAGAFGQRRRMQHKKFELASALPAPIFENGHTSRVYKVLSAGARSREKARVTSKPAEGAAGLWPVALMEPSGLELETC